ncbi:hypothetical protein K490DRAFT_58931 [Saccharata proteae CBS 121410]|uniref:Uncharacterized protein n=1 Tax=Saccharata proteae CBS 121410 TaxID=1314787 RepID=A0A9P4HQH9_9PEZI|nr:hypothetical protein K490DRAFT_58931 [Saccharata proteae CBS 121410]
MSFLYSFLLVSGLLGSALSNPIQTYQGPSSATLSTTGTTALITSITHASPTTTFLPSTFSTSANTTSSCVHIMYPHFNALSSDTCTYYKTIMTETAYTDCGGCQLQTAVLGAGPVVRCAATTTQEVGTSTVTACAAATTTTGSGTLHPSSSSAQVSSAPVVAPVVASSATAGAGASYPVPASLQGYGGTGVLTSAVAMPSASGGYRSVRCRLGRC